jgi:hypothetical protein
LILSGQWFSIQLKAKEDLQKSPEQLEQEKRSVLAQRIPALQLDGKTKEDLIEKVYLHSDCASPQIFIVLFFSRPSNYTIFFNNCMARSMN